MIKKRWVCDSSTLADFIKQETNNGECWWLAHMIRAEWTRLITTTEIEGIPVPPYSPHKLHANAPCYCEECNTSWERARISHYANKDGKRVRISDKINYYPDFPTYKLKRKTCPNCLEKTKG